MNSWARYMLSKSMSENAAKGPWIAEAI